MASAWAAGALTQHGHSPASARATGAVPARMMWHPAGALPDLAASRSLRRARPPAPARRGLDQASVLPSAAGATCIVGRPSRIQRGFPITPVRLSFAMQFTKLGHSCVRLQKDGAVLVIDPGTRSDEPRP
jgi:hypothetical protein